MKRLLLVFIFTFTCGMATAASWQVYVSPIQLTFSSDSSDGNKIYVVIDGDLNPDSCAGGGSSLRIYGDTQQGKYIVSTILTAITTGRQIRPALGGCDLDLQRPIVTGLQIK